MEMPAPCSDCNKLVFVIVETGAETETLEVLDRLDLDHYTRFEQIKGEGETGRKDGDAVFPGINTVLMIAMPEDRIPPLVEALHAVRDGFIITPGMKIIVTDCVMY